MSTIFVNNVGDSVSKIVEPPILMSKVLTFVLATSVVVLGVLVYTLFKMAPLERPEVFFLYTPRGNFTDMTIEPMVPDANNQRTLDRYKKGFIREYVIARNTLNSGTNVVITRNNWSKLVAPWSSEKVWQSFTNTKLYQQYQFSDTLPTMSCSVNFPNLTNTPAVVQLNDDMYEVNFAWICEDENIGGHIIQKNYKIMIRIRSDLNKQAQKDLNKLRNNPLGVQVVSYEIQNDKGDPLNSDMES